MSNGIGIYWLVIYLMVSTFSSSTVGQNITDHTDIYFRDINNLDNLPNNVTTSLFEDDEGFLWVGTQDGIVRYDGYDFVHYRNRKDDVTSFSGMWVNSIVQVSSGDIWIGSREGISIHSKKQAVLPILALSLRPNMA